MNEDTRVAVCCYAGDAQQLNLDAYLHHGCPVTFLSPEDSRVVIERPGVDCRFGGRRAHTGSDSLARQRRHLGILLEYPENYFLINDSDSMCLDPKIPDYLYAEPDLVWSNQVNDRIPQHQATFPEGWPHVAFQPPYFLSRKTIEAMLSVADQVAASPMMPFIDYYMVQLTMAAGLQWKRFHDCACSRPPRAMNLISQGVHIFHGIKHSTDAHALISARRNYLAGTGGRA